MEAWRDLLTENPMLVEARRQGRKFFGLGKEGRSGQVFIIMGIVVYLLMFLVTVAFRKAFEARGVILFQTGLVAFMIPATTYASIAGERERRTWELLMVAPLSKLQIILGKFLSASIVVSTVYVLMLPLIILSFGQNSPEDLLTVLDQELVSVLFGLAVTAISIYLSSRTDRTLSAQAMIYGFLLVYLAIWPFAVYSTINNFQDQPMISSLMWINPFFAIFRLSENPAVPVSPMISPLVQFLFYGTLTYLSVAAAVRSIRKTEPSQFSGS